MRKLFWCCASLSLVVAGGFYAAADHVVRFPQSPVSRWIESFQTAGPKCAKHCRACPCDVSACEGASEEWPCGTNCPNEQFVTPQNWDADAGHTLGRIVIRPEDHPELASRRISVIPGVFGGEESEVAPRAMPYVSAADEAPATMPYVDDVPPATSTYWIDLYKELMPVSANEDGDKSEESTTECPDYHKYHHYFPGHSSSGCCPYSGRCPCEQPVSTSKSQDECEKCNKQKTDTMEARPSDAPKADTTEKSPY